MYFYKRIFERTDNILNSKAVDIFENAPIPKAVMVNIIPSIISMLMVLVYNLADTFFIGQTKNAYMVAAVSLATPAFLLFMAVGMLFGIGGTSLISRLLGEGKSEKALNACSFCFWTSSAVGIIGMLIMLLGADSIAKIVGATPDTYDYVVEYLKIVAYGVPFLVLSNAFSSIIRAEGKASKAMAGMIIGNMANIILDPIMIMGMEMNVGGAAAATTIGNVLSAVFYIIHFVSGRSMLTIHPKFYKAGNGIAVGILAIGIPASLNSILMSVSNVVINNLMTNHGDMAVAGLGVAMKVNMIAVMLLIGLGTGIQPLLGYNFGAGNRKRFLGVLKFSIILAVSLSLVMTVICYAGAGPMVSAFLEEPSAYDYGMQFARIYIISGPILGILFVMINTIQSMGAALPSLILSISRQGLLFMPVLFIFNKVFGTARSLAMAQPVTDYLAAALSVILAVVAFKKYFRERKENV
ncbi:MAG: MATE family efflux transporter [Oscillospiraceae bacterium]|nr:MATE family efflux transporter [Oscillospiraceae bacterium]